MSYGRTPFYIYGGEYDDDSRYFCFMGGARHEAVGDQSWTTIEYDAMAQFVASMWWRDNHGKPLPEGELGDLIARGYNVRPALHTNSASEAEVAV